jgi:hypothetical protein
MESVHGYLAGLAIQDLGKLRDRITAGALAAEAAAKNVADANDSTITIAQLHYYLRMAIRELQLALDSLPDEAAAGPDPGSSTS